MTDKYRKIRTQHGYFSTSPLPSKGELERFYAETYYQTPKSSTYQESYDSLELQYKKMKCSVLIYAMEKVSSHEGGTFLDIGAGEGFLLNAAYESGYNVTGLDYSAFGVNKFFPHLAESHLAGDIMGAIDMLAADGKMFSMCASTNVMEHVLDPSLFLNKVRNVMDEQSVLAITVPNDYSDLQNLLIDEGMIDREFWFAPPHHLHYFNTSNITGFLSQHGYSILDAFSDFPVDLYLLHSGSNYVMNPDNGREANRARMHHDLMIFRNHEVDKYLNYYRAMFNVGIGRDITILVRPVNELSL